MKNRFSRTEQLIDAFQDPEYRFMLLEPILFYGIGTGLVLFVAGFVLKRDRLQLGGLISSGVSALAYLPYMAARREALPRIEQVYQFTEVSRRQIFTQNTQAWADSLWMYLSVVSLSLATLLVGARRNELGYGLSVATVFIGLAAIQNSLWLHYQDATAAHPNLRSHQAPIPRTETAEEHAGSPRVPLGKFDDDGSRTIRQIRPIR